MISGATAADVIDRNKRRGQNWYS